VKSSLAYDSSGNVTSTSTSDGTGTLTATNAMTYDPMGNLLTVDGPLAGTADTTRFRYNAARELVGTISPDPDGSGALKHRAARTTINATTGLPTKVEQGTVNSQSDSDWAAFAPLQRVETLYDVNFRPFRQKLVDPATGTIHAVTDTSYDALGRVECVAQRMNQAAFATGAFADTACSPDSGSFGPDRIVKTIYDAAGQATKVTSAFGVAGEQTDDVTATYTANGQLETLTDAENNKTTYVYDGHDRLYRTLYPSATKGAGTSNRPTMSRTPTTPTATLRRSATGRTRRSATATTR
jgi:YD repeat-containing protein